MHAEAYSLLVLASRYWFVALVLFIVGQLIYICYREARIGAFISHSISRLGTDTPAALYLISDEDHQLEVGLRLPLQAESIIGSSRRCDLFLRHGSLNRQHAVFKVTPEEVTVRPIGNALVSVNGELQRSETSVFPGDIVQLGGLLLRLGREDDE